MRILFLIIIINCIFKANAGIYSINTSFFEKFNDIYLEKYIKEALFNNHDLKSLNHKLKQFKYEINSSTANELPNISIGSNYLGAHFPTGDSNFLIKQNSYIMPIQASYEPDFLLKNRDKSKYSKKIYQAETFNLKTNYIRLLSDVASSYINILLFDYLIEKQSEIIKNKTKNLFYSKNKFTFGVIDLINLSEETEALEIQKVLYNTFVKQRNALLYSFATLISKSPNCYKEIKRGKLENFEYIDKIPKEVEYETISNRPDLNELEERIKSAQIDIRIAKKEFFPNFKITAALVFDTAKGGNFFSWNSSFAYLIAGLTQDIFKGGAKIAKYKIKKEYFLEIMEKYKQADLNAIKEVIETLSNINEDTKSNNSLIKQVNIEKEKYIAHQKRYNAGTISLLELLEKKNSYLQQEQICANSKATRLIDYISLYKALGGEL